MAPGTLHLGSAHSTSDRALYLLHQNPGSGQRGITRFETGSFAKSWTIRVSSKVSRYVTDTIEIWGSGAMALSPDGAILAIAPAFTADLEVEGLALINTSNGSLAGFLPGLRAPPWQNGMSGLAESALAPEGAIAVLLGPGGTSTGAFALAIVSARSLSVDTIAVPPEQLFPGDALRFVVAATPASVVYVIGYAGIYQFDLVAQQVTARAPVPSRAPPSVSPDGQIVAFTDPGIWPDFPGSGRLFLYDSGLAQVARVDLGQDPVTGGRVVSRVVAWSASSSLAFVSTGTAQNGPLYGIQPSRILVIDLTTASVVGEVSLGEYSVQQIYVK
jgi:hypothetical protein